MYITTATCVSIHTVYVYITTATCVSIHTLYVYITTATCVSIHWCVCAVVAALDECLLAAAGLGHPPPQDGTIHTHTHHVAAIRSHPHPADLCTVTNPHVGHLPTVIVPHLQCQSSAASSSRATGPTLHSSLTFISLSPPPVTNLVPQMSMPLMAADWLPSSSLICPPSYVSQ